jgi:RNA polymerase-binding transcription factor DksA
MSHDLKVRYSDEELLEFKELIDKKLAQAQDELNTTQQQISDLNENGFNQQGGDWYDDSTAHTDLEMLQRMMVRQQRYVQDLRNALLRIQNKTYGICSVTGQLIDKNRLRLVPHATKSIDGKNIANSGKENPADSNPADPFGAVGENTERPVGKPIGDKVRLPQGKRPGRPGGEDWEADNETMDDAGAYSNRKFEDDDE